MSVIEHDVEFESSFIEGGYTPRCSCGWSGERCESIVEANDQAEDHFEGVFMEATGG